MTACTQRCVRLQGLPAELIQLADIICPNEPETTARLAPRASQTLPARKPAHPCVRSLELLKCARVCSCARAGARARACVHAWGSPRKHPARTEPRGVFCA